MEREHQIQNSVKSPVIIVSHGLRFPYGTGGAARVANYVTGLTQLGVDVTILCLKPYEVSLESAINRDPDGFFQGAYYLYTCGTTIIAAKRWDRWCQNLKGLIGAVKFLNSLHTREKSFVLLYYGIGHSSIYTFVWWLISRWYGSLFIGESTEAPSVDARYKIFGSIQRFIFWKLIAKLPDGIITISNYLKEKFEANVRRGTPVILMPVLVDVENFNTADKVRSCNVTFCGSLYNKDELESLLTIWAQVWPGHTKYHLRIIGEATTERMKQLEQMVNKYGLEQCVDFYGFVERERLPKILHDSAVFVLPRSAGLFSTAGFPNKLGEYLATGKPVICSAVGDIPLYLKDNENAFLVKPGDTQTFVNKLKYVLKNPLIGIEVGQRGRQVAECEFDLKTNCSRLYTFLDSFRQS